MTYEEYKNNKKPKNKKETFIKNIINKLFTVTIFTMLVIIISNIYSPFRIFIIDKVLNNSLDFSIVNKYMDYVTSVFQTDSTQNVFHENKESERYKDGVKYIIGENEKINAFASGIVTYIGEKEGYNNTIIIQQSNGYYAWYGNIKENIKLYDYIEAGTQIGTSSYEYYYVLLKDDKPILEY